MTKESRTYSWKRTVSSINAVGKTGQSHVKEWNSNYLIPDTKMNSKELNLNVRPEILKLVEENVSDKLLNRS